MEVGGFVVSGVLYVVYDEWCVMCGRWYVWCICGGMCGIRLGTLSVVVLGNIYAELVRYF